MSLLDRIRRLVSGEEIPEEAASIYRASRDERDALARLEAERGRAVRHRETLVEDIRALSREEERLLAEGRAESSAVRRRLAAKQVAEVRSTMDALLNRVDLLSRRVAVFDRQLALIRDRAVLGAPLPPETEVETAAADALAARRAFEEVEALSRLHRDLTRLPDLREEEAEAAATRTAAADEERSFDDMLSEEESRLRSAREAAEPETSL